MLCPMEAGFFEVSDLCFLAEELDAFFVLEPLLVPIAAFDINSQAI